MRTVLIPDEYTADPATAFELGRRWGVEEYEIRFAYRWRVPVGPAWAGDRVAAAVRDYGVRANTISPGLFKPTMRLDGSTVGISTDSPEQIRRHLDELLPAALAFAERLGARNITVFALPKPPGAEAAEPPPVVVETLSEAAERASAAGFRLLLENGGGSWADSAQATRDLLEAVGSDALRLTWDPANVVYADPSADPVGEGYDLVRRFVANVHVKDVSVVEGRPAWTMLGTGVVDWPGQIRRLRRDGYDGPLTTEPHLQYQPPTPSQPRAGRDLVAMMEQFLSALRRLLAADPQ